MFTIHDALWVMRNDQRRLDVVAEDSNGQWRSVRYAREIPHLVVQDRQGNWFQPQQWKVNHGDFLPETLA